MSNWGKGSENNSIGYGQGAHLSTNGWGESHKTSYAGLTDIVGDPALGISYPASALCENASNPTPTVSGNEGSGTFSSTTGLVFVSTSTGEVNISSSTAGATYVITYTDTNAATATFSLTINNLDSAAFAYSASSYEPTGSDPTPTITGLSGGTFSSTSGLVFVDSGTNTGSLTGQIDLSATTEASYTITYNTTSSGSSVCPNTSTQTVEVAVAGIANNYSMSFDGTNDYINAGNDTSLNITGALTVSAWIKPNTSVNGGASIVTKRSTWANINFELIPYGTKVRFYIGSEHSGGNSNTLQANVWTHLVGVFRPSQSIDLYWNGSITGGDSTSTSTTTASTVTNPLIIGSNYNQSTFFNGLIDEVAIWNTDLTATQIQSIYDAKGTNLTKDLTTVSGSSLVYWNRMGD